MAYHAELLRREQELFEAEDDDEVAAAEWVPNTTHIDGNVCGPEQRPDRTV